MNFKNAILTILTFTIAIQFVPPDSTYKSGLPQFSEKAVAKPIEEPKLTEELQKEYFIKPPIGTAWNYAFGNCTFGVASWTAVPTGMGNANQWDDRARRAGYTVTSIPAVGAVAVDNSGYYGHVMLVLDVSGDMIYVKEMNSVGFNRTSYKWKNSSKYSYVYF